MYSKNNENDSEIKLFYKNIACFLLLAGISPNSIPYKKELFGKMKDIMGGSVFKINLECNG
jgi:hypothetical protein